MESNSAPRSPTLVPTTSPASGPRTTPHQEAPPDGEMHKTDPGNTWVHGPQIISDNAPLWRCDVSALDVVLLELLSEEDPMRYELNTVTKEYERSSLIETTKH